MKTIRPDKTIQSITSLDHPPIVANVSLHDITNERQTNRSGDIKVSEADRAADNILKPEPFNTQGIPNRDGSRRQNVPRDVTLDTRNRLQTMYQ